MIQGVFFGHACARGGMLEIGDGYELGVTMDRLFYDWLHSYLFIYCCYATYSSI